MFLQHKKMMCFCIFYKEVQKFTVPVLGFFFFFKLEHSASNDFIKYFKVKFYINAYIIHDFHICITTIEKTKHYQLHRNSSMFSSRH